MKIDDIKYQCWLNEDEKIISFHPDLNYALREFNDHEAFVGFLFEMVDVFRFRVK